MLLAIWYDLPRNDHEILNEISPRLREFYEFTKIHFRREAFVKHFANFREFREVDLHGQ